ncbi:MAG TPA: calcium-binding protein [Tepidisphaeraceae bacterium]|nr:calcium-binding protein [Tepidisphaeraceae bacterium]
MPHRTTPHAKPDRSAGTARSLLLACQRVLRTLLNPRQPLGPVAALNVSAYRVEGLERRVLLAYSPGGDGTIGSLSLAGGTLAHNDRIIIDLEVSSAQGLRHDVVNVTGALTLGGLLDLNALNVDNLQAGNRLDLLQVSGGSLSGAFHSIKGLEATAGLDFAVIQGPAGVSLVATSVPTGDFTLAVDSTTEFNNLVSFLQSGTGSASLSQDSIHFLGQRISGNVTLSAGSGTLGISLLSNANANQTGRVILNSGNTNLFEIYGGGEFVVGARGSEDAGLRLDSFTTSGYTLGASLGGTGAPASNLTTGTVGPLTLERANATLSDLTLDGSTLALSAGFEATKATLQFTKSDGTAPQGGSPGGLKLDADVVSGGMSLAASYDTANAALDALSPTGGFSFSAAGMAMEIPGFIKATAPNGAVISYDPDGGADQTLVTLPILDVELEKFRVKASVGPLPNSTAPGLIVRQDGFQFGSVTGLLKTSGDENNPSRSIKFGNAATLDDPSLTIRNFGYTVGGTNTIAGTAVGIGAGSVRLGPSSGTFYATGSNVLSLLTLGEAGMPTGFTFSASSLTVGLGRFITASADTMSFTPSAADDEDLFSVAGTLSASLNMGALTGRAPLTLTGSAGGFSIRGDGSFHAMKGFGVGFGIQAGQLGGVTGGVSFPSFLGISSAGASIDISWPDFNTRPDRFLLQLSANATGQLGGTSPITLGGSFTNLTIDSAKIEAGQFPIIGISSASITAGGNVFGGSLTGSLTLGAVLFDDQGQRLPDNAFTTRPDDIADSVLWAAVRGDFTVANRAGFSLALGVSGLGLLNAYVRAGVPILLDPTSGLTIDDFRGGITFNATPFPTITDAVQLRSPLFKPTRDLSEDEWLTSLQSLVVNQKGGNAGFLFQLDPNAMQGQNLGDWLNLLNTGYYPDPAWDTELLKVGYALSKKIVDKAVTVLKAGEAWLLDDRGTQFLIEKTATNKFNFYSTGFAFDSVDGGFVSAMPSGAGTRTAAQVAINDGTRLVDVFAEQGITLAGAAVVSVKTDGQVWEVDDNGTRYTVAKKGDPANGGAVYLVVSGGNGTFATLNQTIKIEAGATFYSQYVSKDFFNLEADVIFTTDGNFLFAGDANWIKKPDNTYSFTQSTKIYLQSTNLNAGAGKVFFLSDLPLNPQDPNSGKFSAHGVLSFGFLDSSGTTITDRARLQAGDAKSFELKLAGSETQGIALVDFAGFQRFRLGGKLDPTTGVQYGQATLNISGSQITFDYNANLSAEGLIAADSIISTSGRFVLDFSDDFDMWGVALLEATTEQIRPLAMAGITGQASASIKLNTSDVARNVQLDVPGQGPRTFNLKRNSFGMHLFGSLVFEPPVIGGALRQEVVGAFGIEGSQDEGFKMIILGTMPVPLPLVGTVASPLQADVLGALVISTDGFAGRLELALRDDLPPGTEHYFDLNFGLQFWVNSTGEIQSVEIPGDIAARLGETLPASLLGRLDANGTSVSIPAGAPKLDGTNEDDAPYMVAMGTGLFTVGNVFNLNGDIRLAYRYNAVQQANFWEFDARATLALDPLGSLAAAGTLHIQDNSPNGNWRDLDMVGGFQLTGAMSVGTLSITGYAAIEFNTFDSNDSNGGRRSITRYYNPVTKTATPTTPHTATINPNTLQVFVGGRMDIGPLFKLHGQFVLVDSPQKLSISVEAEMRAFFDVARIDVAVSAELYKGASAGLVLDASINNMSFGVENIFEVEAENISLRINTRNTTTRSLQGNNIAPGLDLEIGRIGVEVFSAFTFEGSGAFRVRSGVFGGDVWELSANLSTNFFDVARLNGSVMFRSSGEFTFDIAGQINLGAGGTGIFGRGDLHVRYLAANAASTSVLSSNDLQVWGNARVEGKLFGITLGAIDVDFHYNGGSGELWVEACLEFWRPFEYDEICVDFTIGFIKIPPPIFLAGNGNDTATSRADIEDNHFRGGTLHLNVGNRRALRNFAGSTINEAYYVEALGPGSDQARFPGSQRVRVVGLGRTQEYDNVTGIYADGGDGSDHIEISDGIGSSGITVSVPVTIIGGSGHDRLDHYGSAAATLRGGEGNDVLNSGDAAALLEGEGGHDQIYGGRGVDSIHGGEGDDFVFWSAGDGDDATLTGGGGSDVLHVLLGTGNDELLVDRTAGQFRAKRLDSGGNVLEAVTARSGFETLDVDANGGTDKVTFKTMSGAGLTNVYVRLGTAVPGARPEDGPGSTADTSADLILLEGGAGADGYTITNPTTNTVRVAHSGVTTFTFYGASRSAGDGLNIDGAGGADTLDASAMTQNLLAVTLTGNGGNDSLVGSQYNDRLDGGLGDDTVTGNAGTDTFADAGGTDTLIESRNADFSITSDTLVIGALTAPSTYAAAAEFERLNGIFENAFLTGGAGSNTFVVGDDDGSITHGGVARTVANAWIGTINLDGVGGSDHYVAWISGSGNAIVNVSDTGASNDGTDTLTMHGTQQADQFLLRANFVASLTGGNAASGFTAAQRVNYGADVEGGVTINGRNGNDHFASDDTGVRTTINGGAGDDIFQIGQMFQANRLPPHVAVGDTVNTTLTTVGYLTNGNSHELTANGGDGKDNFVVFRNTARVYLNGNGDSDTFTVRAFALASTGEIDQARTEVSGGSGDDFVNYAENAPVDIDGGEGYDLLRVLGTEFGDRFLVTENGISGAGLTIGYTGVEAIELHGGDGNDHFYILSTNANVKTVIYGGAGSDRFFVGAIDEAVRSLPAYAAYLSHPRTLTGIRGPLFVDGGVGDPLVFAIPTPVMYLGETDITDGNHPHDGSHLPDEQPGDVDIVDVVDVDATANDTGTLTSTNLSGLGMGGELVQEPEPGVFERIPGGVTYHKVEILDAALGSGAETLNVQSVAANVTTILRGNAGNDRFIVSAQATAGAMLVIYGDNAASVTHRGSPGNDTIDARTAAMAGTYYGGAGNDTIHGGSAADRIAGGSGNDSLSGEAGADLIWGDSGFDVDRNTRITTVLTAGTPAQDNFASTGSDTIHAGAGRDIVFGDHGEIIQVGGAANVLVETGAVDQAQTIQRTLGGNDSITASGAGDTYIFGGTGSDTVNSGDGNDIILGDHGRISFNLDGDATMFDLIEVLDTHIGSGDALAGGAGNDIILGQAGGDTISGGAGNDVTIGDNATVRRAGAALLQNDLRQRYGLWSGGTLSGANGNVLVNKPAEGSTFADPLGIPHLSVLLLEHDSATPNDGRYGADSISGNDGNDVMFGQLGDDTLDGGLGDDYAEGNGGNDLIRGGVGQDDLLGGSSDRFGLTTRSQRLDGSDRIFGGDGTRTGREQAGDLTTGGHARDADVILGDNGNIFHIVHAGTFSFPTFNYDTYGGTLRIKPRVVEMLDYTPGATGAGDIGAADLIHGEDGDDSIWGMVGGDALFGGGEDDDIIGGAGHDWISGGAGDDGIIADDGRIFTSRNGLAEPLHGISAVTSLNENIRTPGGMQSATIHLSGKLKKAVDLEPFGLGGDDIVYGGIGHDSIHGGAGDDALSGAEALPSFYTRALTFSAQPINAGNVLGYGQHKAGEFADYDEYEPRKKIAGHLLNFNPAEADGDDAIFGDDGNDWAVGGTGKDRLYGGRGDDLLNVDDNLDTNGGLNDQPDGGAHAGADLAFGGAGRDVLIGNSEDDRLIDWVGEFNSYIVPFSPFGARAISRALQPQLPEFLLKLASSDGMDMTRIDPNAPQRIGEPNGELGIVLQQDPDWREQTGAPADPQPGSVPGGKRDAVATETFDGAAAAARFSPDSGAWSVQSGGYVANYGGDTISLMYLDNELPAYFELRATARADKAKAGQKANAYLIFDYRSTTDFKFAGFNDANDQVVIGHRTAAGWQVLKWANLRIVDGSLQLMKVAINGTTSTLLINNQIVLSHAFDRRLDDGMIGLGVDNSRTRFDNVDVLVLPPSTVWQFTETFAGGSGGFANKSGTTGVADGVFRAKADSGDAALAIRSIGASANSFLEFQANVQVSSGGFGGLVFDYYSTTDFKYVAYDATRNQFVIGHRTSRGWFTDASYDLGSRSFTRLGVSLVGTTVSVLVDGTPLFGHVYNAALADGGIGIFSRSGTTTVDDLVARGDDPIVAV